jgi:hypothetical protein
MKNIAKLVEDTSPDDIKIALAERSVRKYLERVIIDSSPEPRQFGEIADKWQWEKIFDPIIPAVEYLEGIRSSYDGPHSFWRTMPRGHDKTSSIARLCNHAVSFSRRYLRISVAARDRRQARQLRDAMMAEKRLNPWFGNRLDIDNYQAKGPGGELEILSADAGGAFGGKSDIIVVDELTHWSSEGLWVALVTETIKRPGMVIVVITNAGYFGTWQKSAFDEVCRDPDWDVWEAPGLIASWMTPDKVKTVANIILSSTGSMQEVTRLLDNAWVLGRAGACFLPESVMAMFTSEAMKPVTV